ncbi:hypothetical protein AB6A40_010607 [Gnathostoma spinigerum]|uniref:Uncharacterized protein n=1 Tax=Gnathostoma spinigerum TaxID=75299 RepID=A0ABD6EVS5_9BILA
MDNTSISGEIDVRCNPYSICITLLTIPPFFLCLHIRFFQVIHADETWQKMPAYVLMFNHGVYNATNLLTMWISGLILVIQTLCECERTFQIIILKIVGSFMDAAWYAQEVVDVLLSCERLITITVPHLEEIAFSRRKMKVNVLFENAAIR